MSNGIKYQFAQLGDEYQFEEFIMDLFNERYSTKTFKTYKVKGASQHGIDVYSAQAKVYVQCKKKNINRSDETLKKELKADLTDSIDLIKALPFIDSDFTFILTSTAKRYDLQDVAAKLSLKHQQPDADPQLKDIQYLGWEEIEGWLHELPATRTKYYPPIIPKELNTIPPIDKNEVVGRIKDLENIENLLKSDKPLLLVNGLGGIGKTTMAKYYVQHAYNSYDYIAWITVTEDLTTSLLSDLVLLKQLGLTNLNEEERNRMVDFWTAKLKTIPGKNLLIIDNATKNIEAYSHQLGSLTNWKILFTSRESLKGLKANPYLLGVLEWEDAMQLFRDYYQQEFVPDEDLKKVLTIIGRHTMTIKLLAKTFEAAGRTFAQMQERLESQGLKFSQIHADDPDYQIWDADKKAMVHIEQANIDKWVKTLFTWDEATMTKQEETVLMYFSVLPSNNYGIDFLASLFQIENEFEREQLVNTLLSLNNKGWLDKHAEDGNLACKCHAVLQHVVREKTNPGWDNCEILIQSIITLITIDETKDNPVRKFPFIEFGDFLLQNLKGKSKYKGRLLNELGTLQIHLGNFYKAKDMLESAVEDAILTYGNNNVNVVTARSNLALVYSRMGNDKEAKEILEGAVKIDIEYFGEDHPTTALRRSNLATVYRRLGDFERARTLLESVLKTDVGHFGYKSSIVVVDRANLALVYKDLKEYKKAKKLLELALMYAITNFGDNHPTVDLCRSNLALVYMHLKEHGKSKKLMEKAILSDIKNFGDYHPNVAVGYNNLGHLQLRMGAVNDAIENVSKAYNICNQCLGTEHPNTKAVEEFLRYLRNK